MPDVPIRKDSAWRKKFELEFASPDSGRESVTFDAEMERVHRQGLELQTSIETSGLRIYSRIQNRRTVGPLLIFVCSQKLCKDS